jgi:DNA polymerase-3 subunit beta
MHIIVQRDVLLKPLQALSGVIDKRQALPILSNILLTMKEDRLCLIGTDLEMELIATVPVVEAKEATPITVSGRKLFDICRSLREGCALSLTLQKNNMLVSTEDSSFTLNTLPAQDFPQLEEAVYATQLQLKQADLKQLLTKTYFAMGQQDVRHYLNGALLDIRRDSIQCVAADGHRLALASMPHQGEVEMQAILPRKSVLELMRLLEEDTADMLSFSLSDQRFCVTTQEIVLTSKLIHAQYPDYRRLIPQGTSSAILERESVREALARASILSNEKFRGVRFQLKNQELRITANNADQEQAEEVMSLAYEGNPIEIGFNAAYLMDVVSTLTTKLIRLVFTDSHSGVLIRSEEDEQHLYVVMPMRL